MPTSTLPASIPDTQLGLSPAEIQLLRRHQQVALSASVLPSAASAHYAQSTASSRGRGTARASNASSRAASAASSNHGGGGRLMLDPGSLQVLGTHFERLMVAIQKKVDSVSIPCSGCLFGAVPALALPYILRSTTQNSIEQKMMLPNMDCLLVERTNRSIDTSFLIEDRLDYCFRRSRNCPHARRPSDYRRA